jgi:hypothetical protein
MTSDMLTEIKRQDLTIVVAGVALHGLLAGGQSIVAPGGTLHNSAVVAAAFDIAREFLRQTEAVA